MVIDPRNSVSVLAEVELVGGLAAERVGGELAVARRAQVELHRRRGRRQLRLVAVLQFRQHPGHLFDVVFAQVVVGQFGGVGRRFETRGEVGGVRVVDDYGHHPTEIRATLSAARGLGRRVLVVFQPHRFSRTATLREEFGTAWGDADRVWVLDIYAAGEQPLPGVTGRTVVEAAHAAGARHLSYVANPAEAVAAAAAEAQPGDVILTMGAGDVWKLGDEILKRLRSAAGVTEGRG